MRIPLAGGQNKRFSVNQDAQTLVNLYLDVDNEEQETSPAMYKVPGKSTFSAVGSGPIHALIEFGGAVLAVSNDDVYRIDSNGNETLIGSISFLDPSVACSKNRYQAIFVTDSGAWVSNGTSLTQVADPDYPGSVSVDYLGGYFIFAIPDSQQFYISALDNGGSYDALDYAQAESNVDNIVTPIVDHEEVWLFGTDSTEVWYISGASDFPLARRQGATMEVGCAARRSVALADNTIFWLGRNRSGAGVVYRADGYNPQIISNRGIEYEISRMSQIDDAIAYTYQDSGHTFYVLTFPVGGKTFVYDASVQDPGKAWHVRETYGKGRDRGNCHVFAFNKHLVGDFETGAIWELSRDVFSDGGLPIAWERTFPRIVSDFKRLFFRELTINIERGVGLTNGYDPKIYLYWSDYGVQTSTSKREPRKVVVGSYLPMVVFNRLGSARERIFRISGSDSVKTVILGGYIDVDKGSHP
jgi:hypothetical protein